MYKSAFPTYVGVRREVSEQFFRESGKLPGTCRGFSEMPHLVCLSSIALPGAARAVTGVDPRVAKHALEEHGFETPQAYRSHVLGREAATGPQPVTAQPVRTRLVAWKNKLTDGVFAEGTCGCCAERRSQMDLVQAVFPSRTMANLPVWLGWSATQLEKLLSSLVPTNRDEGG